MRRKSSNSRVSSRRSPWVIGLLIVVFHDGPSVATQGDRTEHARLVDTLSGSESDQANFGSSVAMAVSVDGLSTVAVDAPRRGSGGAWYGFHENVDASWPGLFGAIGFAAPDPLEDGAVATNGTEWVWAYEHPDGHGVVLRYQPGDYGVIVEPIDGSPGAVALGPGILAVGVPGRSGNSGRVLLYRYDETFDAWFFDELFDGTFNSRFGESVAFSENGTVLAVGAPGTGFAGASNGSVRIYVDGTSGWSHYQTITAPGTFDGQSNVRFGTDVALAGPWLAVGAPKADFSVRGGSGIDRGAVVLYEAVITYAFRETIYGATATELGTSVAMSASDPDGFLLVAGAPFDDHPVQVSRGEAIIGNDEGIVYTWRWRASDPIWRPAGRLLDSEGRFDDHLGMSVATDGTWIVAGAPDADIPHEGDLLQDAGTALVFRSDLIFVDGFESGDSSAW